MAPKTPFNHIDAIFTNQKVSYFDELSDVDKKTFTPYVISMGISMNPNFLPIVNEANKYWGQLGPREIYLFYSQLLPNGRQFNKWIKGKKDESYESWLVNLVAKHYEVSTYEAKDYLAIFYKTDEGKTSLRTLLENYGIEPKKLKKVKL
jgi:hypothetical protein